MISQATFFGCGVYVSTSSDVVLNHRHARVWTLDPSLEVKAVLPSAFGLPPGGPYFYLVNVSVHDVMIVDAEENVVATLTSNMVAEITLVDAASEAGTWTARILDPSSVAGVVIPENGHIAGGLTTKDTLYKWTVETASWSTLTASATGRQDGTGFRLEDDGYWVGDYALGANSAVLERLRAGSWSTRTPAPYQAGRTCGGSLKGKGYLISGEGAENVAEYSPDAWVSKLGIPMIRTRAAAIGVVDRVHLISGEPTLSSNLKYDPATDTWVVTASYPSGQRRDLTVFGVADLVFAGGGSDGSAQFDNLDRYDPITDAWVARTALSQGKRYGGAAFGARGKGWYCAGRDDGGTATATTTEYAANTDSWSGVGDMPANKSNFANHGVAIP